MNRDVFANGVVVANDDATRSLGHVNVLRKTAEHRGFEDAVAIAQDGSTFYRDACLQDAVVADLGVGFDNTKGANFDVGSDSCFRANDGGWVYFHAMTLD